MYMAFPYDTLYIAVIVLTVRGLLPAEHLCCIDFYTPFLSIRWILIVEFGSIFSELEM